MGGHGTRFRAITTSDRAKSASRYRRHGVRDGCLQPAAGIV